MIRIGILDRGHAGHEVERTLAERAGMRLDVYLGAPTDLESRIRFAQGAAVLIVRGSIIDGAFMDSVPGLRGLVRCGVGYENIDVDAATHRGILVANVPGYGNQPVSDHALMLILACMRGLGEDLANFGNFFGGPPRPDIIELSQATLGIVGLGRIGSTLAQKTVGLFRAVLACDPYVPEEKFTRLGVCRVTFGKLLEQSDVISLHCSLTSETRHMINGDAFAKMRRRPVLVNTARGGVIDETALLEALNKGQIHSAGLDVFSEEPPTISLEPILSHPRVIATGHYAFYSVGAMAELQRRAAENAIALAQGHIIPDCINPEALGRTEK